MARRYSPKYKRFYDDSRYWSNHEFKPSRRNSFVVRDPFAYINRRIKTAKHFSDKKLCDSGYTVDQGWGGLHRAWLAFILRQQDNDRDGMEVYAKAIRKIQKDINLKITEFADLKLAALEYANDPDNHDILEEAAEQQGKEVDDLNSEDVLNSMMSQDRLAYELAGMQY